MKVEDLIRLEQLYSSPGGDVKVFRGEVKAMMLQVAIKEQTFDTVDASNLAVEEALIQKSLTHPNICKLYSVFLASRDSRIVVISVLEWMGKGDLLAYIEQRRAERHPFTESEVLSFMRTLVEVFALAQDMHICHRDIKPQNIFRTDNGVLKVGDFGSSKQMVLRGFEASLTGSPYFLSPLLKQSFLEHYGDMEFPQIRHDPFKSDMYSLGLTMLFVAKMVPCESLTRLNNLQEATEREIDTLPYSAKTKQLLKLMLHPNEADRPDFQSFRCHMEAMVEAPADLQEMLRGDRPVVAHISLPLICIVCQKSYLLDVSRGCVNIMNLYFCGEPCCSQYYKPQQPGSCQQCGGRLKEGVCSSKCKEVSSRRKHFEQSRRLLESERRCYLCGQPLSASESGECAACHRSELRKWTVPLENVYECLFCHGKWKKVGKLSSLFQRKNGEAIKLPCRHRLCSRPCFDKLVAASRHCPKCLKAIDSKFLKFMKAR